MTDWNWMIGGLIGITAPTVIVLGYYWLRYGVIERRRERQRSLAIFDAVVANAEFRCLMLKYALDEERLRNDAGSTE
jgi:hypothetical protein